MIQTQSLVKSFGQRRVVNDVSLTMKKGEVVGLLGPNGAGKTTTFYMIVGMIRPDSGHVFFNGQDVTHIPMHQRARLGLGYLPQEPSIFKKMTVEQNIYVLWELLDTIPKSDYDHRLTDLLSDMGITHLRHSMGASLSGGEKRRVEIVRALATQPEFILLDEPFAGVDPIAVHDIQHIIQTLRDKGLGIIITDHNVRETLAITDRTYLLHDGGLLLSGTPAEIANDPDARRFYLGDTFTL